MPAANTPRLRFLSTLVTAVAVLTLTGAMLSPVAAYPRPGRTERVSVAGDGTQADGTSFNAAISADGRYVAFDSSASNLVPGDANETGDVFVHDRVTGRTELVSVSTGGDQSDLPALLPDISADGRYISFETYASLVPGDTNGRLDVFVHDRSTRKTERVSVATGGGQADSHSFQASISAEGRYVAFRSNASNLVPGISHPVGNIFVHDRVTGTTEAASVASDGTAGDSYSFAPAISGDGRYVAFTSMSSNLVPGDTNGSNDVFLHDRETDRTERVSIAGDGAEGNFPSSSPSVSGDGRYVAFSSVASNLVPEDTNGSIGASAEDIFVRDMATGTVERVSVPSRDPHAQDTSHYLSPSISADGRYVSFWAHTSHLVSGDGVGPDVYVHDRLTGASEQVSVSSQGAEGDSRSYSGGGAISGDGRYVTFFSYASNLVPGDTSPPDTADVFVHDRGPGLGVGRLDASPAAGLVHVSGWARFSGAVMTSATDPVGDGEAGTPQLGADLVGASLTYRPEQEDLLVRLPVVRLAGPRPSVPLGHFIPGQGLRGAAGAPGVLYALAFTTGDDRYEVRVVRANAEEVPQPLFSLWECDPSCSEITHLTGGLGATGEEIVVSVPTRIAGGVFRVDEGDAITSVRGYAAMGDALAGPARLLDEVVLPDAVVPSSSVSLGIAPAGTPEQEVAYGSSATLSDGMFTETLDVASLPAGEYEVWARACLGKACSSTRTPVGVS